MITATSYRLRPGQRIYLQDGIGTVVRVSDCCAVVRLPGRPRQFTTIFGQVVTFKARPRYVRISPNSEV